MKGKKVDAANAWMIKARNDIISARKLSRGKEVILDTAVYHCQQAAEKAIKSFLIFKEIDFPKTHDLRVLISLAIKEDITFNELIDDAEILTPYATEYRYPDDIMEPTKEEFLEVFRIANKVIAFISGKINFENNLFN